MQDQEAKARLIELLDGHGGANRIGVIDLPSFYAPVDLSGKSGHATPEFTSIHVENDQKARTGKSRRHHSRFARQPRRFVEEAVKLTCLFIKDGPVVLARLPDGSVNVDRTPTHPCFTTARSSCWSTVQRVRGGNRRRRAAGLRPRARGRRHFHLWQGHGPEFESAAPICLAGDRVRDQRSRHGQNHHPQILSRQRRFDAVEGRDPRHRAAGRVELFDPIWRILARKSAALGHHSQRIIPN